MDRKLSPIYKGATKARDKSMQYARDCKVAAQRTMDPVYAGMMRVHVKTARIYHRNAWKNKWES